ncbi:MAG: Uma2 family endonuclease, partial [Chloroflexota bacterium]|nr:Uma2 family endonuclease [Chloroflexota bacterium]
VFQPDVMVIPEHYGDEFRNQPGRLAIFDRPLPFVAEVWSVSTGDYDVKAKLPIYMQRGDAETWLVHPYEKTVTCWRRQPDGTYHASEHAAGVIELAALSGVVIDVAELFT